jgi:hypothetical protein
VTTEVHDEQHNDVTNQGIPLGSTVHDEATVTPTLLTYPRPTGDVTFTFYRNGTCGGAGEAAGTVTLAADAANSAIAHPSDAFGPLAAGSYSFFAHYNGDSNYDPGDGPCEPFRVNRADVQIRTEVHDSLHRNITNSIVVGGTQVHDAAFVTGQVGSFVIDGNVEYRFYNTADCTGPYTSEVVPVGTESSVITPSGGFHSYSAVYLGGTNYNPSDESDCEPFTVLVRQNGRTPGFWSNQNGEEQLNDGGTMEPELALLGAANLKNNDGSDFDPATYAELEAFLVGETNATAVNMAAALSRMLAATILNVEAGFVPGTALVYVTPFGLTGNAGPGNQFMSVNDLIDLANATLAADGYTPSGDPLRAYQEMLKNVLGAINENDPIFLP